jgi:hypothetical protein
VRHQNMSAVWNARHSKGSGCERLGRVPAMDEKQTLLLQGKSQDQVLTTTFPRLRPSRR